MLLEALNAEELLAQDLVTVPGGVVRPTPEEPITPGFQFGAPIEG